VKSSFIAGVGYDKATGTMDVAMTGGRVYGYRVSPEVHRAVTESTSPGGAYNRLVKGTGRAAIARCPQCGRFFAETAHACPARHELRPQTIRNVRAREAAAALAHPVPSRAGIPPQGNQVQGSPPPAMRDAAMLRPESATRHSPPPVDVRNAEFSVFAYMPPGIDRPATAGWTCSGRVATALSRHATSQYVPLQYGPRWANGDTGSCCSPVPVPSSPGRRTPSTRRAG
jgi:hypothetical protein